MKYDYYGTYVNYRSYIPCEREIKLRLLMESLCDVLEEKGVPISCEIIFKEKDKDLFPGHFIDENPDWYGLARTPNEYDSTVAWKARYETGGVTGYHKLREGMTPPALGEE
jgi:hypothetical protein